MIYHIYWGTAGNAGLYLDEIYQTLSRVGYSQKAFVSFYYPFDYGKKIFFKRTEMEHCRYKGVIRKLMQACELVMAFIRILLSAKKDKPNVVNYSYVSRGNVLILYFLKAIKKYSGCKLMITCHDVIPIIKDQKEYEKEISIKKQIYALADFYLVHTEKSKEEILQLFDVREGQIVKHPFPLMDLSKLNCDNEKTSREVKYDFLFIGHMRPEKGVDILLDAWKVLFEEHPNVKLCIAGNPNYYANYIDEHKEWCNNHNVVLKLGFISDDDYIDIVKSARCVVFPYTGGTNSGVISTVVSLERDVITSDIGMFAKNEFVPQENMFIAGDAVALSRKMNEYLKGSLVSDSKKRVIEYRNIFDREVEKLYSQICK